jgi:nitrite reductase (NO-forming)
VEHPPRTAHRLARRAFLRRAGTTAAGGLALTLAACGGGKKAATPTPTTGPVAPSSTAAPTQSSASPAASPVGAGGQGQAQTRVTLEMVDIAFKPNGFTIPANTDVTITLDNTGAALHNFSVTDHKNPNVKNLGISVDVNPGETKTVTVNAPAGDYYYFCNQPGHEAAGMFGTMHVVQP